MYYLKENKELKENYCNRSDCSSRIKDSKKYDSLQQRIDKAIEYINKYDVFKEYSFPLMNRHTENEIKSSIDYEFNTSVKKSLLKVLEGDK